MQLEKNDLTEAEALLREAVDLEKRPTNRGHSPLARALLGQTLLRQGKPADAEAWLKEAVELYRKAGKTPRAALTPLTQLGEIHQKRQELKEAESCFVEALTLAKTVNAGYPERIPPFADRVCEVFLARKELQKAEQLWQETLAFIAGKRGTEATQAICLRNLALLQLAAGDDAAYHKTCRALYPFAGASLASVCWAWVVGPHTEQEYTPLIIRANLASSTPRALGTPLFGAVLVRAGRCEDALVRLKPPGKNPNYFSEIFRALAYRQLGQESRVQPCLDRAAQRTLPTWADRLSRELLLRQLGQG